MVGDNRPFIAALVTIDDGALRSWKPRQPRLDHPVAAALTNSELRAEIQRAIDEVNATVSRAESIRAFAVLPDDLTVSRHELTPTMKVRRVVVEERYAEEIDRLYRR